MDLSNSLMTFIMQKAAEKPSLFPFPFKLHLAFVCVGVIFFAYRFSVQKRPSQIIMAIAMFVSLGLFLSESKAFYFLIGAIELVLLLACFVTSIIFKAPDEKAAKAASDAEDDDDEAAEEEDAEADEPEKNEEETQNDETPADNEEDLA